MTTYKKEVIVTEQFNNVPSNDKKLQEVERTDGLTTEKQHPQNPFETERTTEIQHVNKKYDTTEHDHHRHHKDEKKEHVDTTEHDHKHHKVGKTEHVHDHNTRKVEKTEYVETTEHDHHRHHKDDKMEYGDTNELDHKHHKVGKTEHVHKTTVKSDHIMDDSNEDPSFKEKAKEKLYNFGEKVGLVKPETHITTITEEYNPDGSRRIITEERDHGEHIGIFKPETNLVKTEEIVDANGNRKVTTKDGRENVGLLTQPETHKTKVKVEYGEDGREKIVTERKDNPEHVGLFLPETSKIKTKEIVEPDGTRMVKAKEGTEHMGLATLPETRKAKATVVEESDGSIKIDKELKTNQVQIGINKPKSEQIKTKEYIDPYGRKTVDVVEGREHIGTGVGQNPTTYPE